MPDRIEPCLALLAPSPPAGPQWAFEIKWDGYRLVIYKEPDGSRIVTRGGHDWTERFPTIAEAVRRLPAETAILDGEAVALDEQGRLDFGALQHALGGRGGRRQAHEVIFYAFDLLYLDGHDMRDMPLSERKRALEPLIADAGPTIRLSEEVEAEGAAFLEASCAMGLEGIIAKDRTCAYRSGRRSGWLKIKCAQRAGFVIVGYEPSRVGLGGIGRLLLAARKGDGLVYVGGVGTGFNERTATLLREHLDKIAIELPTVDVGKRRAIFVVPNLVAEIEFRAWTKDGKLRHSSFKGLRDAVDSSAVLSLD
ncbi:ATP-dependent DNA ligase [Rhizobium sp. ARZ01]|nr:ATP-dependent DNA ligase [Rhizobium sp. ARZ01]